MVSGVEGMGLDQALLAQLSDLADVFKWRETLQYLEASSIVVCVDEVFEMVSQLLVALII